MVEYEEMLFFFKKTQTNTYSISLFRLSYSFVVMKKLEHATLLDVVWELTAHYLFVLVDLNNLILYIIINLSFCYFKLS